MRKMMLAFISAGFLCSIGVAQDVNLDGVIDSADLFALSSTWHIFLKQGSTLDLMEDWQTEVTYQPARETVVLELTPEGNEPQICLDGRGVANVVHVKRIPQLAPDNSTVMTPQLVCSSILASGDYWQREHVLTERKPNIYLWGSYYAPLLADIVLAAPRDRAGDFYAVWPHYSAGFSMVRFNRYALPQTKEYQTSTAGLGSIKRVDAAVDDDGNIHIAWTTPLVLNATIEIRYSKFTPAGKMLVAPPLSLGTRLTSSGFSELFAPVIRMLGGKNPLVLIDQGESAPTLAVRVDGTNGTILETKVLPQNFVEPDFVEMPNGDIALVGMIFVLNKGRDIFYTVLKPDLTTRIAPVNLSNTTQQSDGASIAVVEDDFYVAWNENKDNYMRLVRLNANGSRQGNVITLSGPGQGFPFPLRLASDALGMAHIVYADGKGSSPAKVSYEKRKIR
ncbi:MAG TPA: hypothetical protein PKH07_03560 [bacterium]|nr:hypothetical protein [bacterium]